MKYQPAVLFGILLTLICVPALAETQARITIDPNSFAAGQNISNAITGAELRALYVVPNPQAPGYMPREDSGVYAQSVRSTCTFFTLPCSPIGSNVIGYSPVSTPSASPILWGEANRAVLCLLGDCSQPQIFPSLRINFDSPTNYVTALAPWVEGDGGAIYAFAFDSTGQLVDLCYGFPGQNIGAAGCTVTLYSGSRFAGWMRYALIHPKADISFVVIGGAANFRPIAQVQFDSPVSVQLSGLLNNVHHVGPGKSLENKIVFAQTFYAASDIQATCAMLTGFVNEVDAQTGKKISNQTASHLLVTAQAIKTALDCKY